ncbi:Uncharacterized protein dnl_26070 [Desulfonema limicola]|uniref:Peptidase C14 caspase domain-containing protein n=2 Tax=Desulfonema limicola TaxID=45656 RepID=A0A975GGJ2_9BACT|nr:Uncharacterized protein dnl_26070 [Desulfonema limicola]
MRYEKRTALVIGNQSYPASLKNPVNDARAVSKTLKDLGFDVVIEKTDIDFDEMNTAIDDFGTKLAERGGAAYVLS